MGQDVSVDNDDDFQQQFQRNPTALLRDMDSSQAESLRQRLLSNNASMSRLPKSLSMNYKAIFVEYDKEIRVEILFMENEEDLTVGWLMSETLRKLTEFARKHNLVRDFSNIVALKTKDKRYAIDYWLSNNDRNVMILKDRMTLVPFLADEKYEVRDQKITIEYFEILKLIGEGGFSKVYMTRRKDNGQFYAIKVISKLEMMKRGKEDTIFKERNVMTRMEHPYIIKLHFAFQSEEKLFLVLDFLPGGELFYHIRKRRIFSEAQAKVYAAEIILGLNYLHKNNLIYRDLKPENILVDMDGHLNLADFGLCKEVAARTDLNYTFCGSPEYMAPEVISRTGYDFLVDYYALGVLVYELVVGAPPFIRTTNADLFYKILNRDVYFPGHLSSKCKDFLKSLLRKDPKTRLGAKEGMSEIINHPWMKELNYGEIILKKVKVPIKPDPYNLNFDQEFIEVRTTDYDITAPEYLDLSPTPKILAERMKGRARLANFSFYSNFEEAPDKFIDSLFQSLHGTPTNADSKNNDPLRLLNTPESQSRLKKLFESKGLILTDRANSGTKDPKPSPRLSKGPKLEHSNASLRSEIFAAGSEEEKADLDTNVNDTVENENINKLYDSQVKQKSFISQLDKTQSNGSNSMNSSTTSTLALNLSLKSNNTDNPRPLASPLTLNTVISNRPSRLQLEHRYYPSNENSDVCDTPLNRNLFLPLPLSLMKPSTFSQLKSKSSNVYNQGTEDSPKNSPTFFEEKIQQRRSNCGAQSDRGAFGDDIEENYANQLRTFSNTKAYRRDPRVNLNNIAGTRDQNTYYAELRKPSHKLSTKMKKLAVSELSNSQMYERELYTQPDDIQFVNRYSLGNVAVQPLTVREGNPEVQEVYTTGGLSSRDQGFRLNTDYDDVSPARVYMKQTSYNYQDTPSNYYTRLNIPSFGNNLRSNPLNFQK